MRKRTNQRHLRLNTQVLSEQELASKAYKRLIILLVLALIGLMYAFDIPKYLFSRASLESRLEHMSNASHGSDLDVVVYNLQDEEYEYRADFDISGKKLFEHTDFSQTKTRLWGEALRLIRQSDAEICLHNHPHDTGGPSITDLTNTATTKPQSIKMVVAGELLYCFAAIDGWPSKSEMTQLCEQACHAVGASNYNELFSDPIWANDFYHEIARRANLIYELYTLRFDIRPMEIVWELREKQLMNSTDKQRRE